MRTSFTKEQLLDPNLKAAEAQLRSCVHCGICTATCPTYVLLGNELDSPRGRIQIIQQMLEQDARPSATIVTHIDRCLSCLACVSACPSGVNYPRLIDEARAHIERKQVRPWTQDLVRRGLGFVLTRRRILTPMITLARFVAPLRTFLPRRLAHLLATASTLPRSNAPKDPIKVSAPTRRVALHAGCVQEVVAAHITRSAQRALAALNVESVLVEGSGCCGALNHHLGQSPEATARATALCHEVQAKETDVSFEAIITTATGCGSVIKDYGFQVGTVASQSIGARTRDVMEYALAVISPKEFPSRTLRVAYHKPCSLLHGMKHSESGPELLRKLGFEVLEPSDQTCCGSAGVYNILEPGISQSLQAQKAKALLALNANVIVSANIGCLAQIAAAANLPVLHPIELVDWALNGEKPIQLAHLPVS